jgi:hypothetical protein
MDATARMEITRAEGGVHVRAELDPPHAARDARWFQAIAWQGGGFVSSDMVPTGEPGVYRTSEPVPASGDWKAMLRLQRGASMVAVPIWLPADPEIGAPEVPAVDRTARFETEGRYLLREQRPGPPWLALAVYVVLAGIATAWVAALTAAGRSIAGREEALAAASA